VSCKAIAYRSPRAGGKAHSRIWKTSSLKSARYSGCWFPVYCIFILDHTHTLNHSQHKQLQSYNHNHTKRLQLTFVLARCCTESLNEESIAVSVSAKSERMRSVNGTNSCFRPAAGTATDTLTTDNRNCD